MNSSRHLWLPTDLADQEKILSSTRITAAKALIELEMYEDANTLLTGVVDEDDEVRTVCTPLQIVIVFS